MSLFDLFRAKRKATASLAKERLLIIVAQQRGERDAPDYLPVMRNEILAVIRKYVNVDPDAVQINVERDGGSDVLELSVALPDAKKAPPADA